MSIQAICKDAKDIIGRMMSTALSGDVNGAVAVLRQSELSEGQKTKIEGVLQEPRSDKEELAKVAMQQRIIEVVGEETISSAAASTQATHAVPSEQLRCLSFADVSTSPFGNAYPCTFEFGGQHYQNATACFLAQQYTDRPDVMNLFTNLGPEQATALAELNPMTEERKTSWKNPDAEHISKDNVLMHVLRAKFGQNHDLKKQLQETDGAYLACQGYGSYLSDNFNGTGKNVLGTSLMRLRGEYGGTGQVAPPEAYQSAIQSLQSRSQFIGVALYSDVMGRLFYTCASECGFITLAALARVCKHWNSCSTNFWEKLDLNDIQKLCPELTILDAETQGVKCEDEPKFNNLQLLKWVKELSSHVEGNAGVTLLTMTKGTTLNQLIEIAKGEGMTDVGVSPPISEELGDVPIEQTYGILITNSVFLNSRNKDINSQKILVEGHGCVMPTVQEYVALCVFTNKVFKECLYGQNPWTFGRSSTHVRDYPLEVGGSHPFRVGVHSSGSDHEGVGAGGQRIVQGGHGSLAHELQAFISNPIILINRLKKFLLS